MMRWRKFLLVAGVVLSSGCASVPLEFESDIDYAKIARIETAARAVGVTVYWYNHPTRTAPAGN